MPTECIAQLLFYYRLSQIVALLYILNVCQNASGAISEFTPMGSNEASVDEITVELEQINGTLDYRINRMRELYNKPWYDGRDNDHRSIHCVRPAKCEKPRNNTCFGSKMPYAWSSSELTDYRSLEDNHLKLHEYEALKNIPKCWAVIQVRKQRKIFL